MSKRKIVLLASALCMVAILAIGGTLAYFTDTETKTNVFTTGNVDITLVEQQRGEKDGETVLVDYSGEKLLLPIVGSAQGEKVNVGGIDLPVAKNYIDKIITVTNNALPAYVRVYVAIPAVLDNTTEASQNILHFNFTPESSAAGEWGSEICVAEECTIDGIVYTVYYRTYKTVLAKDATTATPAYIGFYLDKDVDYDNDNGYYTITRNGETEQIDYDFSQKVKIPVYAVGAQAEGFTDADAAIDAAFGENFNPWAN
ncbi:MAG: SipW-dependent-type signal peptide-containing protein [Aristaeellaceae bacterium]